VKHYGLNSIIKKIHLSRGKLPLENIRDKKSAEEGGCGVTGFISSIPVRGRHIHEPSFQMHNRGNGKGGGIAAVGLSAESLGVSQKVLDTHYLLQVALLDPKSRSEVESSNIEPFLEVHKAEGVPTLDDYREVDGLEVKPPDVWRYFVRVKKNVLDRFIEDNQLHGLDSDRAEDEFIYQNSAGLCSVTWQKYYDFKNRWLCRAGYPVLSFGRFQSPRLDCSPAISHQRPGMASRRRAPFQRLG
jgi:hypothetical protein